MTARIRSLTIALDEDIRTDDIECLVNAIQMMRNVHSVTTNEVNPNDWVTERRVKLETAQKLNNLINEIIKFKLDNLITELYTN
jgi:signal recognition particle subunit SEC65